jgi:hypothetical protein
MKKLARSGSHAIARLKLRFLGFLLSLFGGASLNSCGLYYPPVALYMPPPAERVEVSGLVLAAGSGEPIPGIQVEVSDDSTPPNLIATAQSADPDGSFDMSFTLYQTRNLQLQAKDVDGPSKGSNLDATQQLGTVDYAPEAGTKSIRQDVDLDSSPAQ